MKPWAIGIEATSPLPDCLRTSLHVFRARCVGCQIAAPSRQGSVLKQTTTDCFRPWLLRHRTELVRHPPPGLIDTQRWPSFSARKHLEQQSPAYSYGVMNAGWMLCSTDGGRMVRRPHWPTFCERKTKTQIQVRTCDLKHFLQSPWQSRS